MHESVNIPDIYISINTLINIGLQHVCYCGAYIFIEYIQNLYTNIVRNKLNYMNKKYHIIGLIVVILAIVVIISIANTKKHSAQLTFGMIAGMTGDYAAVGDSFAKGAKLAQSEWNAAHPGRQIAMITEDDGFDAKKGISAYKKLTSIDHIDGLINMTTVTIDSIYSDSVASGIPVALGFEQGIEAKDDNIVQLWPGSVPAEVELGAYVKEKGFKNVVIFVDKGSSAFERFAGGFEKGYASTYQEIQVSSDGQDIKSDVLKAVSLKPDAIAFITKPTSGALLVKELRSISQMKYQYIFDADIQTGFSDYVKILGDMNALNGSILYTVPNVYRSEFNDAYKKMYGVEPAIGSETGYNAFMLLAQTYDPDKVAWVNAMKHTSFTGADGKIMFDDNGVRIPELKIGTIEGGKLPN